ncbi:AMP-binding protein [Corynebacterium anserum]|uniref:AMP-binding protein n=1 Tax=Corynebacterium anserum TaxID=2684406 RepID=A0A7G7YLN3_9CORY|nr:AMP-binding protein [Corynebacterium anserum]QNH95403.1 AMP-binding protein [Corynebacterium anserum]
MAESQPTATLKQKLAKKKFDAEGVALNVKHTLSGIPKLLKSGIVVRNKGAMGKVNLFRGIAQYRFSCARQLWYSAYAEPDRVAIIDDFGEITYKEMLDQAKALARYLQANNMGVDGRVGVIARNSRIIPLLLSAKGFCGFNVYLLNVASSPHQLQECIEEHSLDAVFMDEEFGYHLPADWSKSKTYVAYAEDMDNPKVANPEWQTFEQLIAAAPSPSEEKLATFPKQGDIIIMSSGTSGTPKGVRLREPIYPVALPSIIERVGWKENLVIQQTASLFHAWGWANVNISIAHRSTVILRRVFDPVQAMEDLEKYRCRAIITSPIFIKEQLKAAKAGNYDIEKQEFVVNSGNILHEDLLHDLVGFFGPVVRNFYGSTENSVATLTDAEDILKYPMTTGKPAGGTRLEILDEKGNPCSPNEVGRIYCRNVMSLRGYTNPRDKAIMQRGLYEIGDKGYVDENGRLFVLGRADDMIIVGGENIYPRSVEECLFSMPGIRDLYAHGVSDENTFQRIKVWLVRDDNEAGAALTEEAVQEWVREKLMDPAVPRDVEFMDELPRNPTGKVMPRLLPGLD